MSMRELDRCKVIQAVVEDGLMVWRALVADVGLRRALALMLRAAAPAERS